MEDIVSYISNLKFYSANEAEHDQIQSAFVSFCLHRQLNEPFPLSSQIKQAVSYKKKSVKTFYLISWTVNTVTGVTHEHCNRSIFTYVKAVDKLQSSCFFIFLDRCHPASERHQLNSHLAESVNICGPAKATIHMLSITEHLYPNWQASNQWIRKQHWSQDRSQPLWPFYKKTATSFVRKASRFPCTEY